MKEQQPLIKQTKTEASNARKSRKRSYVSYIERFPLYSTLIVLKEYEGLALFEECAIIRDALIEYKDKYSSNFPEGLNFPMHLSVYKDAEHQGILEKMGIVVDEKVAKEKATLIKLNLPV
jgi:hypothetical protein